jgi:hypothetical protein
MHNSMILYFPDSDTLRLAITSGTVPPVLSLTPAVAGLDEEGHIWIATSETLPRSAQKALTHLGVGLKSNDVDASLTMDVCCWLQVLPLERAAPSNTVPQTQQTAVLFELTDTTQLSTLVAEILRVGNDRQSFRWLESGPDSVGFLRVIGPPYYSLLRALDRGDQEMPPRAYVEQAPRVWVEIGFQHPFAQQLNVPKGKLLLLRSPREWIFLDEAPFTDIYDILEFELPSSGTAWQPAELNIDCACRSG